MGELKDFYKVKPIDPKLAQQTHVKNHYLHRKSMCSHAFGLYDGNDTLRGVILYGSPASPAVARGICGKDEALNVIELTRLWIDDSTPKNAESFLIGNTIPLVSKEIIVSYAEPNQGHLGIVYQSTNWIYVGLSAKRTNWDIQGVTGSKHNRSFTTKYSSKELKEIYGDKFSLVDRPRKHRYIYFNTTSRKRKKELLAKLKYEVKPYPKWEKPFMSDTQTKEEYTKALEELRLFLGEVYLDGLDNKPLNTDEFALRCKVHMEKLKSFLA